MTATTTQREIRSPQNGRVPKLDSPAVPARARARIAITNSEVKKRSRISSAVVSWWGWTARPLSLRATWALSAVDRKRIPHDSGILRVLWQISNWTDRLIMFVLIVVCPTVCSGPLRWIAQRPTRRAGLYLTLLALVATIIVGRIYPS
jgi:hypothetical protein